MRHSEVANKFDLIKFTLAEDSFKDYHRYTFSFQDFLNVKTRVELVVPKVRKSKPNGLVINAEMKESN